MHDYLEVRIDNNLIARYDKNNFNFTDVYHLQITEISSFGVNDGGNHYLSFKSYHQASTPVVSFLVDVIEYSTNTNVQTTGAPQTTGRYTTGEATTAAIMTTGAPLTPQYEVTDPSFEIYNVNPDSPWTQHSLNYGTPICDSACWPADFPPIPPPDGQWFSWFGGTSDAENGSIAQYTTIPSTVQYLFFYILIIDHPSDTMADYLEVMIDDNLITRFDKTNWSQFAGTNPVYHFTYYNITTEGVTDGNAHWLTFNSYHANGDAIVSFLVDVVEYSDTTPESTTGAVTTIDLSTTARFTTGKYTTGSVTTGRSTTGKSSTTASHTTTGHATSSSLQKSVAAGFSLRVSTPIILALLLVTLLPLLL